MREIQNLHYLGIILAFSSIADFAGLYDRAYNIRDVEAIEYTSMPSECYHSVTDPGECHTHISNPYRTSMSRCTRLPSNQVHADTSK
jgi:hypothetical protein